MHEPMEAAIKHAKFLARYLNKCSNQYVIQIALKETGMRSSHDGFHFSEYAVLMLYEDPFETLEKGIYPVVGQLRKPPAGQEQVEQSNAQLEEIIEDALCEAQIESLVIAKGYADCVAYMSSDGISVAVAAPEQGLQQNDVAVITDIILTQSDYDVDEIHIVEVQ